MLLQFLGEGRFEILRPLHLIQIVLHQRADGLACRLVTHLERVALADLEYLCERVFPGNWLVWSDSLHFEVVLVLFESWEARVHLALVGVPRQVLKLINMRDEGLLDQVRHLLLVVRGFEDAATSRRS